MGPCHSPTPVYSEGSLRLWYGELSAKVYAYEYQTKSESSSRRGASGRGSKSAFCDRHWIANVSDGWHATGYCVCAGLVESLHVSAASHHQVALQRLLRYINATQSHRITYRSGKLIGYTDAEFGGSVVTDGAYSASGYVFQLAGVPVSWSSKRQGEVATSTTMRSTLDNIMPFCIYSGSAPFWLKRNYIGLQSPTSWPTTSPLLPSRTIPSFTNGPNISM